MALPSGGTGAGKGIVASDKLSLERASGRGVKLMRAIFILCAAALALPAHGQSARPATFRTGHDLAATCPNPKAATIDLVEAEKCKEYIAGAVDMLLILHQREGGARCDLTAFSLDQLSEAVAVNLSSNPGMKAEDAARVVWSTMISKVGCPTNFGSR